VDIKKIIHSLAAAKQIKHSYLCPL